MEILLIALTAFLAAILTFFSGFGLGTLLTPVFILFFPVELAIALTGIVHFLNNIFKLFLVGGKADKDVVLKFGIPAVLFAFAGSWLLVRLSGLEPLFSYQLFNQQWTVYPLKLVIALLLFVFALMDLVPSFNNLQFSRNKLPLGGALSGFFGGLSGNQGALRSAFLVKAGLSKEAFIGTAVVVSTAVDFTRLGVYFTSMKRIDISDNVNVIVIATLAAITGAYIGNRLLKKVTLRFLQLTVGVMLLLLSLALGAGFI